MIITISIIIVWKNALISSENIDDEKVTIIKDKGRQINQGDHSQYIEKNKGDINVN